VDAAYKTHGYKFQSLVRLKIAQNSPDISYRRKIVGYKTYNFSYKTYIFQKIYKNLNIFDKISKLITYV